MKTNIWIIGIFCLLFSACKDREYGPLVTSDNKPGAVSSPVVENFNGGAKISYTLPADEDLLYVEAVYATAAGQTRSVKSSVYKNFIELEGFPDSRQYDVTLYAVNQSENRSEPLKVTIHPLTPPVDLVFGTLTVREAFGGVNILFENEFDEEFVYHTMYKDEEGAWVLYDRLYSSAPAREYPVRGLESRATEFGFFVSDRWKNASDTLRLSLTPLYEEELDKALWAHLPLPTDTYEPEFSSWEISNLWKGGINSIFYVKPSLPGLTLPNWFTIDLGGSYKFSRIRVNQLSHNGATDWMFSQGSPKKFEIWGSNDPDPEGSWTGWTLLGEFESRKPSGRPVGQLSDEDIATARAGEDFEFPVTGAPGFRYIRFKTLTTWGGSLNVMMSELTLWGQPVE